MASHDDYITGWIDTSIHDFLSDIKDPTSSMAYALITCLDSDFNVHSLVEESKHLKGLRGKLSVVGQGILVTTRQLLAADKCDRLFFGFDEVWFFPNADVKPKPSALVITGPEPISSDETDRYGEWLRLNNCSLGLGDGTGLNFCLKIRGVARYIVEAFKDANSQAAKAKRESA